MRRNLFKAVALIAGFVIAGGLVGIGARKWVRGLDEQHAQLHRCITASEQSHRNEDARALMEDLDRDVPECMDRAGYEKALDNDNCSLAVWQGDVYCYVPKSRVGKLIYKIQTFSVRNTSAGDQNSPDRADPNFPFRRVPARP